MMMKSQSQPGLINHIENDSSLPRMAGMAPSVQLRGSINNYGSSLLSQNNLQSLVEIRVQDPMASPNLIMKKMPTHNRPSFDSFNNE